MRGKKMTRRFAETAPPGRHYDGGGTGLLLYVKPSGGRFWVQKVRIDGRQRELGLGSFTVVSLAEARAKAAANKKTIAEGRGAELLGSNTRRTVTFSEAVEWFLGDKLKGLSNDKHRAQWRSTLETYALPALGKIDVDQITTRDVLRALEPIWDRKTETASRLRGRIERVLSWATVAGYREGENPARWRGNLSELLPAPAALKRAAGGGNHPAVALGDLARWWKRLDEVQGMGAAALRFAALTAARSGEVREALWQEIEGLSPANSASPANLGEAAVWRIPAQRMKAKREHVVPLSRAAVELLLSLPHVEGEDLVFPGARAGRPMSDMTLAKAMKTTHTRDQAAGGAGFLDPRSGRPAVPHGLRSSFRDWAAEQGWERDMAELALAHDVGNAVERAYRRTDMVQRRRTMMDAWAAALQGRAVGAKVLKLGAMR